MIENKAWRKVGPGPLHSLICPSIDAGVTVNEFMLSSKLRCCDLLYELGRRAFYPCPLFNLELFTLAPFYSSIFHPVHILLWHFSFCLTFTLAVTSLWHFSDCLRFLQLTRPYLVRSTRGNPAIEERRGRRKYPAMGLAMRWNRSS